MNQTPNRIRFVGNFITGLLAMANGVLWATVTNSLWIGVGAFLGLLFVCAIVQVMIENKIGKGE